MSKRKNNEWEPEANKRHKGGSSSMPKLQMIDVTHVQAMLDYRKALIAKIESVFQGAKPEDGRLVPVSALQTEFLKARLFALSADQDKCREMAKVLEEYLVMLPGVLSIEPSYRLRDRNQAMEKRLEELKSELADREHQVQELATKHEQDTATLKKLRAQILQAEFDLNEKQEKIDRTVKANHELAESSINEAFKIADRLSEANTARRELTEKVKRLQEDIKVTEDAYTKADHERLYLEDQLSRARGDLAQARLAAEIAQKETATVREETEQKMTHQLKINKLLHLDEKEVNDKFANLRSDLQTKTDHAQRMSELYEGEVENNKKLLEQLAQGTSNATATEMEFDIKMKQTQIERLRGELTSAREALLNRTSQLGQVEKELADSQAARNGMNQMIEALTAGVNIAREELESQKKLATEADIVAKQADAELEDEFETVRELESKLEDAQRLGEEREAELKSLRQRVEFRIEQRIELELKLATAETDIKKLEEQLAAAKADAEADQDIGQGADVLLSDLHATATVPDMKMASPAQMGDVVALKWPGMAPGANYWLAMVLERNSQKKEIRVMYYEEAGDDGYKPCQGLKHEWVADKFIAGRIRRIPVTARERQDLQTRLHGGIVAE